jgi:hypothetical protein
LNKLVVEWLDGDGQDVPLMLVTGMVFGGRLPLTASRSRLHGLVASRLRQAKKSQVEPVAIRRPRSVFLDVFKPNPCHAIPGGLQGRAIESRSITLVEP